MKTQLHIYYSGRVQGIGMRYTLLEIARSLGVAGWARNLSDGRVEVLAEAQKEALDDFLKQVKEQFCRYIEETDLNWHPQGASGANPGGEFRDFQIVF
jgi:acylphosphatase